MEYWEKLLLKTKQSGLTIPYILGSKLINNLNTDSVETLFQRIINSPSDNLYCLHNCPDIGEYVLSKCYSGYKMNGIEISNPKTQKLKLILALNTEILGKDLKTVVDKLTVRYSQKIKDKTFSYKDRKWYSFNEKEIAEIKSIL